MKTSKHPTAAGSLIAIGVVAISLYLWNSGILRSPEADRSKPGPYEISARKPDAPSIIATENAAVSTQTAPAPHVPDREWMGSGWRTSPRAELAGFARWVSRYVAASGDRAALLAEGLQLAKARREVMVNLIKTDPREALANTLPVKVHRQLPPQIQELLEERVSKNGDIYRVLGLGTPESNKVVPAVEQAYVDNRVFEAHRYGDRAFTPALKGVSIHGIALDGQLAILDSPLRKLEEGETVAETSETCVVTGGVTVVPKTDAVKNEAEAKPQPTVETTTMLVGDHGYSMCCPFCAEDFETRMERLERQGIGAVSAVQAISADANNPRALSSSGINGSADYPGKPPYGLTHGTNTMIMMRVDFPDHTGNRFTEAELAGNVNDWGGVNWMVDRFSYGQSHVASPTITPVLRMPHDTAYYNNGPYWGDILNDANAAAAALGYDPYSASCRVIIHDVVLKDAGAAGWGGGGAIWCNNNVDKRLLIHEYGHVFWLPHANSWGSSDGNPLSDSRWHVEYGDASDPMGNAWGTNPFNDYNAYYKSLLGWLPDSAVLPVTHSGTYRINQFDGWGDWTSRPVVLKITRDNNLDLWVMFRGDGVPQGNYNAGAYIIGANGERFGDSHVLDMNDPSGDTGNAPLAQGQTWTDAATGISITTAGRMMTDWPHHMYVKVNFPANYNQGYRMLVNGGIYALRNRSFNQYLTSPDLNVGSEPGISAYTGATNQQWIAQRNSDGTYSLKRNGSTDLFLDVAGNGGGNYNEILQWSWNGGDQQRWDVLNSPDGYLKFRHKGTNELLTADTAGGNYGDVIQYDDFNGTEEQWEPALIGINDGTFRLVPRHAPAMTLGLRGRSGASGTLPELQNWAGGEWQGWTVQSVGSGQFRIYPQNKPSMTLGVTGASTTDGAAVALETYTGASSQKFTFTATGMGFVRLSPVHAPNMCIDASGAGTAPGTVAYQWTYLGGNNQQWRFIDSNH